jgi:hypothetical protein
VGNDYRSPLVLLYQRVDGLLHLVLALGVQS